MSVTVKSTGGETGGSSVQNGGTGDSLVTVDGKIKGLIPGTNITFSVSGTDITINSSADDITVVANYSALPAVGTVSGKFYWCSASQGTAWLPGSLGGTYYSAGLYYSNGVTWEFLNVPYNATQAEVDTGTNTDKFVTPATLKNWPGSTNLITLGSVTTGTWSATAIGPTKGGTGLTSVTTGDILYGSAANTWSALASVSVGSYFRSNGVGSAPLWSTLKLPNTATVNQVVHSTATDTWGSVAGLGYGASILNPLSGQTETSILTVGVNASSNGVIKLCSKQDNSTYGSGILFYGALNGGQQNTLIGSIDSQPDFDTGESGDANKIRFRMGTWNNTGSANGAIKMFITGTDNLGRLGGVAIGFGAVTTAPTAWLHLGAGTATARQNPLKYTTGPLNTTQEAGATEFNGSFYKTTTALNRYAEGGIIADFTTDVNNGTTVETDLYTYTTKASTLSATGEKLEAWYAGTFNDLTATSQLKVYFAGTAIADTGALTVSATGGWSVNTLIIRTGASTARAVVTINTPGASTALYTSETDLTGLTFTNTNIIKITGQAGGASGSSNDITAKLGTIKWFGAANN